MPKTNKAAKIMIALMIAMMLASSVTVSSSATEGGNQFLFVFFKQIQRTNYALKENNSPMYIFCEDTSVSFTVAAYGADEYGNPVPGYKSKDGTVYMYHIYEGDKRYVKNYVYEEGCDLGCIQASTAVIGSAEGLWSADSVYEDGVLSAEDYIE